MRKGASRLVASTFALVLGIAAITSFTADAHADDTTEAAALFESGNRHLQSAQRLRGPRREQALTAALSAYVESLRIVRSRNVLFNASLALEQLERYEDAFNYLAEYLAVPGLSEQERAEAISRQDALRPRVAVLSVRSTPARAEVWIDRRDLTPRGRTPLEHATTASEHRLWLRTPSYREAETTVVASLGSTTYVEMNLEPEPISLQVLAPPDSDVRLDDRPIAVGQRLEIAPGPHVLSLHIGGLAPIERRFDVQPGAAPVVIDLSPMIAAIPRPIEMTLTVVTNHPARVTIDGQLVGGGSRVETLVQPGEHEIRVEAERHAPFSIRRRFSLGDGEELRVDLAELRGDRLIPARIGVGIATGISLVIVLATTAAAISALDDFDTCVAEAQPGCEARADTAEFWGISAYTSWGIAGALVIAEVALLLARGEQAASSTGSFALVPVPGGAMLAVGGAL